MSHTHRRNFFLIIERCTACHKATRQRHDLSHSFLFLLTFLFENLIRSWSQYCFSWMYVWVFIILSHRNHTKTTREWARKFGETKTMTDENVFCTWSVISIISSFLREFSFVSVYVLIKYKLIFKYLLIKDQIYEFLTKTLRKKITCKIDTSTGNFGKFMRKNY